MASGAKSYVRKSANILSYMRTPLVIYEYDPISSEFPNICGKFYFIFYLCVHLVNKTSSSSCCNCQRLAAEQPQTRASGMVRQGRWH